MGSPAGSSYFIELDETFGAHNYKPLDIVISRAKGCKVWDPEGHEYYDFLSAYSAVNQGHCHPRIIKAAKQQLDQVTLTSRAFRNNRMGPFLKTLCGIAGYDMALPMNSGAEAVSTALKLVRRWGYRVKGIPKDKANVAVCSGNFHGRTITIVGFSSEEQYRADFGPFTPGFTSVTYGDINDLKKALGDT
ncbi:MAG: aminotransferase class III-fold pyridoxal phosphate-dependent enzyme, partial [bacterium]|nr:aminotransferase class III-fold pyridoxal phosphate-dependent enzyme [bacterium]